MMRLLNNIDFTYIAGGIAHSKQSQAKLSPNDIYPGIEEHIDKIQKMVDKILAKGDISDLFVTDQSKNKPDQQNTDFGFNMAVALGAMSGMNSWFRHNIGKLNSTSYRG
jgi:hypothetical protein